MAVVVTTACVQIVTLEEIAPHFWSASQEAAKVWVDGGYRGKVIEWVKQRFRYHLEVVLRSDDVKGFIVLPKRWIVERTFAFGDYQKIMSD